MQPVYFTHPRSRQAHIALSEDVRQAVTHGSEPKTRLALAKTEVETLQRTAELGHCVGKAVVYQIGQIEANGNHPAAGYRTAGEAIQAALKGVNLHSSKFYELRIWANKILKVCEERGLEVPAAVFKDGNAAKFYQAANYLSPIIRANDPNINGEIEKVLADIVDTRVGSATFMKRYTHNPKSKPLAFKANGYLIIKLRNDRDEQVFTNRLANSVEWTTSTKEVQLALKDLAE